MAQETIHTKISMGDAGWPLDVQIDIYYVVESSTVYVRDTWEVIGGPDNPSEVFYAQCKERIEEHFETLTVIFI